MSESKRDLGSDLAKLDATTDEEIARQIADDPDTAPELTDEQLDQADLYEKERFIRRVGRPKGSGTKELITLRIDHDVLDRFRATGPGWQTRINDVLRALTGAEIRPARSGRSSDQRSSEIIRDLVRGDLGGPKKHNRVRQSAPVTGSAQIIRDLVRGSDNSDNKESASGAGLKRSRSVLPASEGPSQADARPRRRRRPA
jgi:uncharacterized protein (DUF4415 family)